jgi:SAM-dependent methyltransferase
MTVGRDNGDVTREGARWEEIAKQDPMWAILAFPDRKYGRWDDDQFFRTGAERIEQFVAHGAALGRPVAHGAALDFGCGVGRLTRALTPHFDAVTGVDISETMVAKASELNGDLDNCTFRRNDRGDLTLFADRTFDFVVSDIVLQHLPDEVAVDGYLCEFVRVLRPGGLLVFQLPAALPLAHRFQPRRTAYLLLRRLGLSARMLYWRLGLHPNRMLAMPESRVIRTLTSRGGNVVDVVAEQSAGGLALQQNVYYVTVGES